MILPDCVILRNWYVTQGGGKLKDIAKVKFRMHDTVREDLLEYLQKNERQTEI